jgi:hypothetical protein
VACEMALEAAYGLAPSLAFGLLAFEVGTCLRVDPGTGYRYDVKRAIELAVTTAVQAMTVPAPGGDRDRGHASMTGELRVCGETLGAGGAPDQGRCRQYPQPLLGQKRRTVGEDQRPQLALEAVGLA